MAKLLTDLRGKMLRPTLRELMIFYGRNPVAQKAIRRVRPGLETLPPGFNSYRIRATADFAKHVQDFDSISLDIFDTLIFRVHRDPELIKPRVSHFVSLLLSHEGVEHDPDKVMELRRQIEWHLCEKHKELGHDPECTLAEISEAFFKVLGAQHPKCLAEKWLEYELLAEQSWIDAPDSVKTLLQDLKSSGKRIFFLSDMYMTEEAVEAILEEKAIRHFADEVFVSGSRRIGKYSGNMFRYLQEHRDVDLSKHIHVGDSIRSDVVGPSQVGASAVWLMDWKPDARPTGQFGHVLAEWTQEQRKLNSRLAETNYRLGFEVLGPAFFAYTVHMLDEAIRDRTSAILFLAREGDLFKWIAEQVWEKSPRYRAFPRPRMEYALISRGSCAPAALYGFGPEEIEVARVRRPPLTLRHFCETFRLPEEEVKPFAWRYSISMHEPLQPSDPRLLRLMDDDEFESYGAAHGQRERAILRRYLESLGFAQDAGTVMLCDMGWSGTMQHLIKQAFRYETAPKVVGCYFGMHWNDSYDFSTEESTIKPGYVLDSRKDPVTAFAFQPLKPLLEIAATARHGSTDRYEEGPDGVVRPVLAEPRESFDDGRIEIQDGLRDFVSKFVDVYALYEWPPHAMKWPILERLKRELLTPSRKVAVAVGRLTQSVDWGSNERVHIVPQDASPLDILRPRKFRRHMREAIWPVGALRQMGLTEKQYARILRGVNLARKILRVLRLKR